MTLSKTIKFLYIAIGTLALGLIIWLAFFFSPVQMPALSTHAPTSTRGGTPTATHTKTAIPIPTSTVTQIPMVKHKIIYLHFGIQHSIEFESPATWKLEKLGEWDEFADGEKTGYSCSNYVLRKPRFGVLFISPPCGTGEGIPVDCPPGAVVFWEAEEQDDYGRRGAHARYYNAEIDTYVYYDAWIGNHWTTGGEGVFCMSTWMESSADDFLKAQYHGEHEHLETTLKELDQIVLSIEGLGE